MKGMTAKDPTKSQPAAATQTVARDGFLGEMRTGRLEAASLSKEGMNQGAIAPEGRAHERSRANPANGSIELGGRPRPGSKRADGVGSRVEPRVEM
jgi:hypothetical protein